MQQVSRCFAFFERLPWYDLIPDTLNAVFGKGRGVEGSLEYVCAAFTANKKWILAYIPSGRTIQINASILKGKKYSYAWFNPQNGFRTDMRRLVGKMQHTVKTPGAGDWVMIMKMQRGEKR
jgi:hypothetical protein